MGVALQVRGHGGEQVGLGVRAPVEVVGLLDRPRRVGPEGAQRRRAGRLRGRLPAGLEPGQLPSGGGLRQPPKRRLASLLDRQGRHGGGRHAGEREVVAVAGGGLHPGLHVPGLELAEAERPPAHGLHLGVGVEVLHCAFGASGHVAGCRARGGGRALHPRHHRQRGAELQDRAGLAEGLRPGGQAPAAVQLLVEVSGALGEQGLGVGLLLGVA